MHKKKNIENLKTTKIQSHRSQTANTNYKKTDANNINAIGIPQLPISGMCNICSTFFNLTRQYSYY